MSSTSDPQPLYEIKANLFKGLAHPFRIRILELLSEAHQRAESDPTDAEAGELSVAVLLRETGLEASHLSQHLSVLRRHRLVVSQRRGSHVYYRLLHASVAEMLDVVRAMLADTLAADEKLLTDAGALPQIHRTSSTQPRGTAEAQARGASATQPRATSTTQPRAASATQPQGAPSTEGRRS